METSPGKAPERSRGRLAWLALIVPIVGLAELGAHFFQVSRVVPDADWKAASEEVARLAKPEDLVVFAPTWTEPLGRHFFGDKLATIERVARPDDTRFPRAIEVSIRGEHLPELRGWKKIGEEKVGAITLTTLENPAPARVIYDLVNHVKPEEMRLTLVDPRSQNVRECGFVRTNPITGYIFFGSAIPGDRFDCNGAFAGVTVMPALDYTARRCIFAPPQGAGWISRLRFAGVEMGKVIHGHHGIAVFQERDRVGAPVTLTFFANDKRLGQATHADGDGWKGFEIDTGALAGQKLDLVVEVSAPSNHQRKYCFEADTR